MAYDPQGLFVLSYADGFTLWHYATRDRLGDVRLEGYFEGARAMFRDGDRLFVNVRRDGRVMAAQDFCIASSAARMAVIPTSGPLYPALVLERTAAA